MRISILAFWGILVVGIILLYILRVKSQRRDNIIIALTIVLLSIFNFFKDWQNIPDIMQYVPTFKYISSNDSTYLIAQSYYRMQYGYFLLNKIIAFFSNDIHWFMFAIGFIISAPYFYFIKKYSPYVWLSCILYFMGCTQGMFVLRQYSAMAFCLLALIFLIQGTKKSLAASILLWAFAVWIHPTAIIFGAVYLMARFKAKFIFPLIFIASIIVFSFFRNFLNVFVENTRGYSTYLESEENNFTSLILESFYLCSFIIFCRPLKRLSNEYLLFFKMMALVVIFQAVSTTTQGGGTINRMMAYFMMINFWVLPYIASRIKTSTFRYTYITVITALAFYLFAISHNSRIDELCAII